MIRALGDLRPILALFLAERRGSMLGGLAIAATTMLAGLALLGLSGWFITATAIAGLSLTTALAFDVFMPSAGTRLLALGRTASRYGERLVTHEATLGMLAALRERLFRGWAQPRSARRLLARPARLLHRLTSDIDALDGLYLRLLVPLATAFVSALAVTAALGFVDFRLGVTAGMILIVLGFGIPLLAARLGRKDARLRAHALEALRARIIDLSAGQVELLMAGRLEAQRLLVGEADRRLALADDRLNRIETRAGFGFGVGTTILMAGTLCAVAVLVERGVIGVAIAAFAVLLTLAAAEPFAALRRSSAEFGRTLLAAQRLGPKLAAEEVPLTPVRPAAGRALMMQGVSAEPDQGARAVLHGIELAIEEGEHVAIVGSSGSGKSTLLAVLAGELAPARGECACLDAALMTQRTQLFQDSLRANLQLAAPDADDRVLWSALEQAGLAGDLRRAGRGLDTMLGEGGTGLSEGQARRLSLARMILRDAPVWLLDEPTESIDEETARDVLARLKERAAGRTVLIATHSAREARLADRLLVLDQGRVIADLASGSREFGHALARLRDGSDEPATAGGVPRGRGLTKHRRDAGGGRRD